MRATRVWMSAGALAAALAWVGCERQEGTGGSGPAATVEKAQEESKRAFEAAKEKQEEAARLQEQARSAQQDVQQEQQDVRQAEQEAQQESQAAIQAQQEAQQQAQASQQRAQQAQQQASQAMEQQRQQEQQAQAQQAQEQATQAQQQAQQQPQQQQPAFGGSGGAATGQQQQTGQQQISGELSSAQATSVTILTTDQGAVGLIVDPSTQVFIDGQQRSIGELQQGSDVRASYSVDQNQQKKATRIDATSAQPDQGMQQQQQNPPMQ